MYEHRPYAGYYEPGDAYRGADPAEVELAYLLQNSEVNNPRLLPLLVGRYAGDIYRLVQMALARQIMDGSVEGDGEIQQVVQQVFVDIIQQIDQFRGESSVRNWIFGVALRTVVEHRRRRDMRLWLDEVLGKQGEIGKAEILDSPQVAYWASLDRLPDRLRLPLLLRYVHGLEIAEIADILKIRKDRVHANLSTARHQLLVQPGNPHFRRQIQAHLDGLLDEDPVTQDQLRDHLAVCTECKAYSDHLKGLEERLKTGLQARWPARVFLPEELERIVEACLEVGVHQPSFRGINVSLRQVAWLGGLGVIFVLAISLFAVLMPQEAEYSSVLPTPTTILLPTPIAAGDGNGSDQGMVMSGVEVSLAGGALTFQASATGESEVPYVYVQILEPNMSSDGQYLAFSLVNLYAGQNGLAIMAPRLFMYGLKNQTLWQVSSGEENLTNQIYWWNFTPSLSADGRYVAYGSQVTDQTVEGENCRTVQGDPCADVFVLDQSTGVTELIPRGYDGSPANGDSFYANISGNGRWVAFWSSASNLVNPEVETCGSTLFSSTGTDCMNIFLYDREKKETTLIPIGTTRTEDVSGYDRITISEDGRYLAFTVGYEDQLSKELGITSAREAYLYDRETGNYVLLDVAADGSDGNGVSFSPVISANGRYAAFASSSTNLVQGDNNNFTDVFVRDLQTGAVEMVSVATDGEQGNGQSGAFYTDMGYNSIDISEDGRYIVFLSNAKNLVQDRMAECEDDGEMCNAIYLHDRETGQTELVRGSETYRTYVYPEVSTDGRYISYMVFRLDCIPFQEACSDIMLHDRQSGWASNMTQMSYNWPLAPWVPADYWSISGRPPLEISVIKFSPDGKYIAIVGNENRVRLWDIKKNQLAYSLESGTDAALLSLDFSADGELLAGGTTDGILNIWSLPERRRLFALNSQEGRVHSVQFFPGSQDVLAATDRGVWIWRRGEESYSLASHLLYPMNFVDKVALSPKGNLLAVAGSDQTVWLQLLPSGTLLTRLDSGKTIVTDVVFSPDGTLLAALAQDGRIDLWKVGWQGVGALDTEHLKTINDVGWLDNLAFSADGQYLASSSFNGVIWLWKIPEGKTINLYNFSSYSPGISAVAFSPDGNSLVAAMQTAIQFWRSPRTMFTTQYFKYLDSDEFHQLTGSSTPPADDLPMNAYVGQGDGGHLNLYDADRRLSFNVRAPDRIPSDMYFREASLLEDGGVMLRYELIPPSGKGPKSTLYIYERLISVGISIMPVGSSANVEQVPLGSDDGEYVRGDWVLSSSTELGETQTDVWTWDSNLPVQRLRWKEGGISYDIYYVSDDSATNENGSVSGLQTFIPYDIEQGQSSFNLSRDDLVQIAESLSSIPAAASSPLAVLSYTVQAGDTCSGIAMTYGTSVEAITALNHLTSCEIIYVDQQILVPLSSQRQLMYETDMDCNGTLERLQIVLTSLETPQSGVYGVGLETLDNRGLYRNVWQYTIADGNAAMLTIPALFNLGTCQQYIAFGVLGGDDPGLKVYQWDGEQALQIYNDPIVPASMVNPTGDRFTFKVQIPVLNPDSGTCQLVTAVYDWEERVYVLASQTVEEGIGCYHP